MDEFTPSQWIAKCAERLHECRTTVERAQLEEAAVVLLNDANLRSLPPQEAAARWLSPITTPLQ